MPLHPHLPRGHQDLASARPLDQAIVLSHGRLRAAEGARVYGRLAAGRVDLDARRVGDRRWRVGIRASITTGCTGSRSGTRWGWASIRSACSGSRRCTSAPGSSCSSTWSPRAYFEYGRRLSPVAACSNSGFGAVAHRTRREHSPRSGCSSTTTSGPGRRRPENHLVDDARAAHRLAGRWVGWGVAPQAVGSQHGIGVHRRRIRIPQVSHLTSRSPRSSWLSRCTRAATRDGVPRGCNHRAGLTEGRAHSGASVTDGVSTHAQVRREQHEPVDHVVVVV